MKAIILAGGYGTRLGELTRNCAKPLLEVGGKALITHLYEKLTYFDAIEEVIVVTNERFYKDFLDWSATVEGKPLRLLNDGTLGENDRLGSIGDINFAIQTCSVDDDLLILGGDNLFTDTLSDFVSFFKQKGSSIMVHDVGSVHVAKELGIVDLDESKRITSFVEKPEHPSSTLASTLIYAIDKKHVPYFGQALASGFADRAGDFIKYLSENEPVYALTLQGQWFDIGTRDQLEQACKEFR